ncbi:MAG: dTDP-4-dehydrorhamnose reductase [Clostridia bacterium]|nr:dTDP-4-dehydrorhamnose reductase [Clostridia bacterium]
MKVLITGANGMLAKEVREKFENENELILTDVAELDITNEEQVMEYIKRVKPDLIINCAAFTAVDKAETAGEIVEKINADGPGNLAKAAKAVDCALVHISTDYVFGGDLEIEKDYKEDDSKNPVTAYGITKLHGEEQIQANTDKYYIFRTAWLYGIGGNNFVKTMLKLGEDRDELSVVADQHGSPTYAKDLSEIIYQAVTKKIPYGVYNSTNEGYTTWYDFTKAIFEYTGTICKVNPVTTEEYIEMMNIVQAKRPKNSQMSKEKLKANGINVPEWEDGLKRYLKEEGRM